MQTANLQAMRALLARYASARFAHAERETPESRRALQDATRALCAATATSAIEEAIEAADLVLEKTPRGRTAAGRGRHHGTPSKVRLSA